MHARTAESRCTHLIYYLTCEELDALYRRAAGRCEICGVLGRETPAGLLFIDHDGTDGSGRARVRGLLCGADNTRLARGPGKIDPDVRRWYLRRPVTVGTAPVHSRSAAITRPDHSAIRRQLRLTAAARAAEPKAAYDARVAGHSTAEIAAALGRSSEWVRRHLAAERERQGRSPEPDD